MGYKDHMSTMYEQLGGADKVRQVVTLLVRSMRQDLLIGYLFRQVDEASLIEREFEHAARALGAKLAYHGRPILAVHRPLRLKLGQFNRRMVLLRQALQTVGIPAPIATYWLGTNERFRATFVQNG